MFYFIVGFILGTVITFIFWGLLTDFLMEEEYGQNKRLGFYGGLYDFEEDFKDHIREHIELDKEKK